MGNFETIIYDKSENVGFITLNRPALLNVYNLKMRDELYQTLQAIKDDDEVRVVIIRGAGDKAFCAGADLTEFLTAPSPVLARQVRFARDIWRLFSSMPQPLIAALHGYVLGSGIEISLFCDIRIASEDTKFGLPEVGLGIIPAAGGTQTLPRVIGVANTLEMLLAGRWLDAGEACHMKMVNKVVKRSELWPVVELLANKIKEYRPKAVTLAKQAIVRGLDMNLSDGLALESRLSRLLI